MWLIVLVIILSVLAAAMIIGLHVQETNRRKTQGAQGETTNDLPPIVYTVRKTPEHNGPSIYDRMKGGQRPFGENAIPCFIKQ